MVFYFKARPKARDYTIFMGLNKYENEELIKYGFPDDIRILDCICVRISKLVEDEEGRLLLEAIVADEGKGLTWGCCSMEIAEAKGKRVEEEKTRGKEEERKK
ncbi:hypothetical protein ACH5RR_029629 [Cinchona calisaya]|uniref:Uncharacterized protein n=1 Tax=Cinchona calisaya TaxID=153742 RepID=A0ABD2YXF9_9GENT